MAGLGLHAVASVLRQGDHDLALRNFPAMARKTRALKLPVELSHLEPFLLSGESGPTSFFSRYQRLGPSPEDCAGEILSLSVDLILLSCFAFAYADDLLDLVREIRRRDPDTPIGVGGAGATVHPLYFLADGSIQYVFLGEAEISLMPFLRQLTRRTPDFESVPNLMWMDSGSLHSSGQRLYTGDDDIIPVCAVSPGPATKGRVVVSASFSRGCPHRCRFCSIHLCHGRGFRKAPLDRIAASLPVVETGDSVHVNLEDDSLLTAPAFLEEIVTTMRRAYPQLTFTAENGLESGLVTAAEVRRLGQLGARGLNLSLASADASVLSREGRVPATEPFAEAVTTAVEVGLPTTSYVICGLAGDTHSTVVANLAFLYKLPTKIAVSLFYPVPGLPGFTDLTLFESGASHRCGGSAAYPWTGSLTTRQLTTVFRLARFLNLLKSPEGDGIYRELVEKTLASRRLQTLVRLSGRPQIAEVPETDTDLVEATLEAAGVAPGGHVRPYN